eukprot:363801-Chlamydomonas_euryale.AAC.22
MVSFATANTGRGRTLLQAMQQVADLNIPANSSLDMITLPWYTSYLQPEGMCNDMCTAQQGNGRLLAVLERSRQHSRMASV